MTPIDRDEDEELVEDDVDFYEDYLLWEDEDQRLDDPRHGQARGLNRKYE